MAAHKRLTEVDLACGQSASPLEESARDRGKTVNRKDTGPGATYSLGA